MKSANTSTSNGNRFSVAGRRPGDKSSCERNRIYRIQPTRHHARRCLRLILLGIDAIREFNVLTDTYAPNMGSGRAHRWLS